MKITLVGYMGSGKSTIGRQLALAQGFDFYDLDVEIEKETGYTITETIFNKGELYFRQLEKKKLEEILAKDNFVLSLGGGTPCYYDNIDEVNKNSLSIYLQYGVAALMERLEGTQNQRPLISHLKGEALQEFIGKHLFERNPFYERSIVTIKAQCKSHEEILDEIKALTNE
jgi:shikimate kinase